MTKFETLPDVKALCERGGVREDDYAAIHTPWFITAFQRNSGRKHCGFCSAE